jgi:NACHT domain
MERIEGTKDRLLRDSYVWIVNYEDFMDWRDGDETQLLWIKGDPGKGKTMLLIGIVKEMQSTCSSTLLSYFFCQATDRSLNSATAVLRGLIYRLLIQRPSLMSHVRDKYDKAGKSLFEDSNAYFSLSQTLTNILHDSSVPGIYLIVDALDECESGLSQLLDLIRRTASTSRVKWLVSSRHRDAIEEQLRPDKGRMKLSLELNARSHVANALTSYINHKVEELARLKQYKSELQDNVRHYIQAKAETFHWVALVCRQLAKTSPRKAMSLLQRFPPELPPFYLNAIGKKEALS